MDAGAAAVFGGILAVTMALVKVIEVYATGRAKKSNGNGKDHASMETRIKAIGELVARCDAEGTPLIYTPRWLGSLLRQQTEIMRQQKEILVSLRDSLQSHVNKEEAVMDEVAKSVRKLVE